MNHFRTAFASFCALGALCSSPSLAFAQDAVELKAKYDAAKAFKESTLIKLEQVLTLAGQDVETGVTATEVKTYSALPADEKGNIGVKSKVVSRKTDYNINGVSLSFDTANPNQAPNDNPVLQGIIDLQKATAAAEFTYRIDPKGNVVSAEGGEKILEDAPEGVRAMVESELKAEALRKQFADRNDFLPEKAVKAGDTWTKKSETPLGMGQVLTLTTDYKYLGEEKQGERTLDKIEGTVKSVDFKQEPNPMVNVEKSDLKASDSKITILFDRQLGLRFEDNSMLRIEGDMTISVMGQQLDSKLKLQMDSTSKIEDVTKAEKDQ